MNGMLDYFLVGVALCVSALYLLAVLGPRSLRRRVLSALGVSGARAPGACGGCANCGARPPAARER